MSWSMIEPEELPVCECKYDEARDEMDRGDCPFHYDLVDNSPQRGVIAGGRSSLFGESLAPIPVSGTDTPRAAGPLDLEAQALA
jgi:hypothetical protein